jgi:hypothetical protein
MNWDAAGAIGEIMGAVAVLATLLYLAKQIRQSNQFSIAANEISIRDSFGRINEALYGDTELARITTLARNSDTKFEDIDYTRYLAFLRQCINTWLSIEKAYENGMTSKETYNVIFDDVEWFVREYPAGRYIMRKLLNIYSAHTDSKLFAALKENLDRHESIVRT